MKKFIGIVMGLIILLSATCFAFSYPDVSSTFWARDYIDTATFIGIVQGYPDGTFKPNKQLTRGEYIKMVATALYSKYEEKAVAPGEHWARQYVKLLTPLFFYEGQLSDESLDEIILRGEMASITATYNLFLHAEERQSDLTRSNISKLKDANEIPEKYIDAIDHCIKYNIIEGFEDGTFRYDEPLTRAQAAKVIIAAKDN